MSSIPDGKWDQVFSTNRKFREDWSRSFVDQKRDIGAAGEGIEIFLQDYEDSGLDDKVEELMNFAAGVTLQHLEQGAGSAGLRRGAWLDQRSITGEKRDHKNPFTATQLHQRRKVRRIGAESAPNSDRCLTYIQNLDAFYMLALIETAQFYEVPLLRDAIWKHYARQTSLKVTIPHRGYKIFQLEFHLQFFKFVAGPTEQGLLNWTDLSFLEEENNPEATGQKRCGMYGEHFSFVICGFRENGWGAYAFDTESDGDDLQDKIDCRGHYVDPIGSCLPVDDIDANLPIWNPREYFLNVVARRVTRAADSWEGLLRAIERRIQSHRRKHPSTLSNGRRDQDETAKTFDWTQQTIDVVNNLRRTLSETNKQWERFNIPAGNVDYFSDSNCSNSSADVASESNYIIPADNSQNRLNPLLCEIREQFQRLETVQRALEDLSASCKDAAKNLELRLSLESHSDTQVQLRLARESNIAMKTSGASTDFQIFILFPIGVAAACLQYAPTLMPLPPAPAVVVLTGIFVIVIKLLHVIFRRLCELDWCWRMIKASVKARMLGNSGGPIIRDDSSSSEYRHSINIDRTTTIDVEKGTFPS